MQWGRPIAAGLRPITVIDRDLIRSRLQSFQPLSQQPMIGSSGNASV